MKICILTREMLSIGMAAASRVKAYAKSLSMAGNEVEVYSPFGFPNSISSAVYKEEVLSGGTPYRFFSYMNEHPREGRFFISAAIIYFFLRQLGYLRLYFKLMFKKDSYDILLVYEFSIWHSIWIRLFSMGKPLVYELCEIPFPLEYPNQLFHRRLREWLNFIFADGFIVISDNLYFYIKNIKRDFKIIKIPILVDEPEIEENISGFVINSPCIFHAGTINPSKDFIKYVMEAYGIAMNRLNEKHKFHFYLTCDLNNAPDSKDIEDVIIKYNIQDWVHFIGYQKEKVLHGMLKESQLAVVYKENNEQNYFGFPTKIGVYFRAGVPVVISPVGEMQNFVQHEKNGFIVELCNSVALAEVLEKYFMDINKFTPMANNALETARKYFSLSQHGERLSLFFKQELLA